MKETFLCSFTQLSTLCHRLSLYRSTFLSISWVHFAGHLRWIMNSAMDIVATFIHCTTSKLDTVFTSVTTFRLSNFHSISHANIFISNIFHFSSFYFPWVKFICTSDTFTFLLHIFLISRKCSFFSAHHLFLSLQASLSHAFRVNPSFKSSSVAPN